MAVAERLQVAAARRRTFWFSGKGAVAGIPYLWLFQMKLWW